MTATPWLSYLAFALVLLLWVPMPAARGRRLLWLAALAAIGFVPVAGLPLAAYWHSLVDELAITSLLWMAWAFFCRLRGATVPAAMQAQHRQRVVFFALLGLLFYPATMGMASVDPYSLGFVPWWPMWLMLLACVGFCLLGNTLGAALLLLATLAYLVDIKASGNYWDYVLDPVLVLYCWGSVLRRAWRRYRGSTQAQAQPARVPGG